MNDECMAKLAEQWGKICQHYSVNDHVKAQNFIQQHSSVLVNEFYSNIVLEPEAADFFKDDIIQQRLKNSLNQWLIESFDVAVNEAYYAAVEKQQKVGQVHARVGIPSWLIMRGIR
ncbi:protoglobin domain-containing protein, partial [Acinetobacter sp.]